MYAIKNPTVRRSASIPLEVNKHIEFDSGLIEMRWLSSGCWCVKRKVFEDLRNEYPELIYDGDDNASGKKVYGFYIPYIYDMKPEEFPEVPNGQVFRKYLSEDWSAIQRWRELNPDNKVWCDTGIVLRHIGKFAYTLWDVEVQSAPRPSEMSQQSSSKLPSGKEEINLFQDVLKESVKWSENNIKLPPPGFDLQEEMEKGNLHL